MKADIFCLAPLNDSYREWRRVSGPEWLEHHEVYRRQADEVRAHGRTRMIFVGQFDGRMVVTVRDEIANLFGKEHPWSTEGGVVGKGRPNELIIGYSFQDAKTLPHVRDVHAAFEEDAKYLIEKAYKTGSPLPPSSREFQPSSEKHQDLWAKADKALCLGKSPGTFVDTGRQQIELYSDKQPKTLGQTKGNQRSENFASKKNIADSGTMDRLSFTKVIAIGVGTVGLMALAWILARDNDQGGRTNKIR